MFGRELIKQLSKTCLFLSLLFSLVLSPQITFSQGQVTFPQKGQDQQNSPNSEDCLKLIIGADAKIAKRVAKGISLELNQNGVCNVLRFVPQRRATAEFLHGNMDGEIGRVIYYKEIVQDQAIIVPTPLLHYQGFLFTKDKNLQTVAELQGGLGVVRGSLWMKKVSQDSPNVSVYEVTNWDTLVKLLENDRVQAILLPKPVADTFELPATYHHFKVLDITIHLWLRSRHQGQVEKVDKIIADFIKAGGDFLN